MEDSFGCPEHKPTTGLDTAQERHRITRGRDDATGHDDVIGGDDVIGQDDVTGR